MKASVIRCGTVLVMAAIVGLGSSGCATQGYQQRQSEINSSVVGGVIGGVIGAIAGDHLGDGDNEAITGVIGAAIGAGIGNQFGRSQDQNRQRVESLEAAAQTETVYIQNRNGSFTPVTLFKMGYNQYRGPRGEIYQSRPTEEQLKQVYGF